MDSLTFDGIPIGSIVIQPIDGAYFMNRLAKGVAINPNGRVAWIIACFRQHFNVLVSNGSDDFAASRKLDSQ